MAARIAPDPTEEARRKKPGIQHRLVIVDRETISIEGVLNVESFDDEQIVLETNAGILSLVGQGLHIRNLNLEDGAVEIEGMWRHVTMRRSRARGREVSSTPVK